MNLKKSLAALMLAATLFSCKKDSTDTNTNTGGGGNNQPCTGTLELVNTSKNPYKIYINGAVYLTSMAGGTVQDVPETAGTYVVRVVQLSGYAVYATDKTYTGSVICDQTTQYSFP